MKMKTTGYALREARKQHELRRDTAARAFNGSLKTFEDENKETPQQIVEQFLAAERSIAALEVAQSHYNLMVFVDVLGRKISLASAVKLIGGEARVEKMWRSVAGPVPDRYRHSDDDTVRDPTQLRAKPTIRPSEATRFASQAAKRSGAYRAAIATANAKEL